MLAKRARHVIAGKGKENVIWLLERGNMSLMIRFFFLEKKNRLQDCDDLIEHYIRNPHEYPEASLEDDQDPRNVIRSEFLLSSCCISINLNIVDFRYSTSCLSLK